MNQELWFLSLGFFVFGLGCFWRVRVGVSLGKGPKLRVGFLGVEKFLCWHPDFKSRRQCKFIIELKWPTWIFYIPKESDISRCKADWKLFRTMLVTSNILVTLVVDKNFVPSENLSRSSTTATTETAFDHWNFNTESMSQMSEFFHQHHLNHLKLLTALELHKYFLMVHWKFLQVHWTG